VLEHSEFLSFSWIGYFSSWLRDEPKKWFQKCFSRQNLWWLNKYWKDLKSHPTSNIIEGNSEQVELRVLCMVSCIWLYKQHKKDAPWSQVHRALSECIEIQHSIQVPHFREPCLILWVERDPFLLFFLQFEWIPQNWCLKNLFPKVTLLGLGA
jgi:hypothetical protein